VNKQLWSITAEGDKKWERDVEDLIIPTPLILSDATVCFQSGWGVMLNMGLAEGVNWVFPGVGRAAPSVSADGAIYVSDATQIKAVRTKAVLMRSPWPKFRGNPRNTGNVKDLLLEVPETAQTK